MGNRDRGPIPEEKREQFLELIGDGAVRWEAAKEVGESSSRFRGLIGRDADFAERYATALECGGSPENPQWKKIEALEKLHLAGRLLEEYITRALDPQSAGNGSSNRLLHNLCLLLESNFKPLLEARMHRHVHEGAVGLYAMPQIDTAKWTLEEQEEFVRLDVRRAELLSIAAPDDATRGIAVPAALPAGNGHPDIDVTVTE